MVSGRFGASGRPGRRGSTLQAGLQVSAAAASAAAEAAAAAAAAAAALPPLSPAPSPRPESLSTRATRLLPLATRLAALRAWYWHPLLSPFFTYDPSSPRSLRAAAACSLLLVPLFLTAYAYTNVWWQPGSPLLPALAAPAHFAALAAFALAAASAWAGAVYALLLPATAGAVYAAAQPVVAGELQRRGSAERVLGATSTLQLLRVLGVQEAGLRVAAAGSGSSRGAAAAAAAALSFAKGGSGSSSEEPQPHGEEARQASAAAAAAALSTTPSSLPSSQAGALSALRAWGELLKGEEAPVPAGSSGAEGRGRAFTNPPLTASPVLDFSTPPPPPSTPVLLLLALALLWAASLFSFAYLILFSLLRGSAAAATLLGAWGLCQALLLGLLLPGAAALHTYYHLLLLPVYAARLEAGTACACSSSRHSRHTAAVAPAPAAAAAATAAAAQSEEGLEADADSSSSSDALSDPQPSCCLRLTRALTGCQPAAAMRAWPSPPGLLTQRLACAVLPRAAAAASRAPLAHALPVHAPLTLLAAALDGPFYGGVAAEGGGGGVGWRHGLRGLQSYAAAAAAASTQQAAALLAGQSAADRLATAARLRGALWRRVYVALLVGAVGETLRGALLGVRAPASGSGNGSGGGDGDGAVTAVLAIASPEAGGRGRAGSSSAAAGRGRAAAEAEASMASPASPTASMFASAVSPSLPGSIPSAAAAAAAADAAGQLLPLRRKPSLRSGGVAVAAAASAALAAEEEEREGQRSSRNALLQAFGAAAAAPAPASAADGSAVGRFPSRPTSSHYSSHSDVVSLPKRHHPLVAHQQQNYQQPQQLAGGGGGGGGVRARSNVLQRGALQALLASPTDEESMGGGSNPLAPSGLHYYGFTESKL